MCADSITHTFHHSLIYHLINSYGNFESNEGEVETLANVMLPIFDAGKISSGESLSREKLILKIRDDIAKCTERVGNVSSQRRLELYVAKGSTRIWTVADKFRQLDRRENNIDESYPVKYVKIFLDVLRTSFDIVVIDLNPNADGMNREFSLHSDCVLVRVVLFLFVSLSLFEQLSHTHFC